jgi:hypothetical protein
MEPARPQGQARGERHHDSRPHAGKKPRTDAHSENALSDTKTTEPSKPEWNLIGFRPVYVWDVSQTEGKELLKLDEPQGDVSTQLPKLIGVRQAAGHLDYSDKIAPAKGISYGGAIRLLPNMAPAEEFATLVHEVAHEMIHKAERRNFITKIVRETEAQPIAFVVSQAVGLENGTASSDYIQLYHGNATEPGCK